ncbi:MAG: TIGR00269 family protein [Methanobacterium sp.]|nr:TIGR00269 family protein [Methanobacterium sp.]
MEPLSRDGFNQNLKIRVRRVIEDYELLKEGEKIAIALSGGKDSVLTLHLLNEFKEEFKLHLVAIAIDEGISGYREKGLKIAREITDKLGIELVEKSFDVEINRKLDQINHLYKSSCVPCGVFRRYILNKTAYQLKADKLATGHNLDDEIQSFLMSFAKADFRRFPKFGPKLQQIHPKLIPRIKPLWNIPEKDVGTWAVLNDIPVHFGDCPYAQHSLRSKIKNYLNKMEEDHPGTKISILKSFKESFKSKENVVKLVECDICGEPSSLNVCKACQMLEEIKYS